MPPAPDPFKARLATLPSTRKEATTHVEGWSSWRTLLIAAASTSLSTNTTASGGSADTPPMNLRVYVSCPPPTSAATGRTQMRTCMTSGFLSVTMDLVPDSSMMRSMTRPWSSSLLVDTAKSNPYLRARPDAASVIHPSQATHGRNIWATKFLCVPMTARIITGTSSGCQVRKQNLVALVLSICSITRNKP
jgi:hypothetical protein